MERRGTALETLYTYKNLRRHKDEVPGGSCSFREIYHPHPDEDPLLMIRRT